MGAGLNKREVRLAFRDLRRLSTSVIGFHDLSERDDIRTAKRIEYEAQLTASGVALAHKLVKIMDAIDGHEKLEADQLMEAVGYEAARFDRRSRTLLTNICALAEQMAQPNSSMTREDRRIAAETIFACGEALQLATQTFTHMITPEPK